VLSGATWVSYDRTYVCYRPRFVPLSLFSLLSPFCCCCALSLVLGFTFVPVRLLFLIVCQLISCSDKMFIVSRQPGYMDY
jgi:hypothetical protein